jgi:predicted acyl esterase
VFPTVSTTEAQRTQRIHRDSGIRMDLSPTLSRLRLSRKLKTARYEILSRMKLWLHMICVSGALMFYGALGRVSARNSQSPTRPRVNEKVKIPMRDGVKLVADIVMPPGEGKFPVILPHIERHSREREFLTASVASGYPLAIRI